MCSVPARRENKVGWRTAHARFVFLYKGSRRAEAIYSQPHKSINVDKDIIWDHGTLFFHLRADSLLLLNKAAPSATIRTQTCLIVHPSNCVVHIRAPAGITPRGRERRSNQPPRRTPYPRHTLILFGRVSHADEEAAYVQPALRTSRPRLQTHYGMPQLEIPGSAGRETEVCVLPCTKPWRQG